MSENRAPFQKEELPVLQSYLPAGFASPADDYVWQSLNINELFEVDDVATYFLRVDEEEYPRDGILPGDILAVRKDGIPRSGDLVIAVIDSECSLKRYRERGGQYYFESLRNHTAVQDGYLWGVVTGLARNMR